MSRLSRLSRGPVAILLGSTLLCAGCMKVGPDYAQPKTEVSPEWIEARDARVSTESTDCRAWWEAFEDPVLTGIVERAYRENVSLKIAGVRVLEARAQLGIAIGNFYPQSQQASGSLDYLGNSERSATAASALSAASASSASTGTVTDATRSTSRRTTSPDFTFWQDQIGVSAAWELDFWGKFRRNIESADATLSGAVADYDAALVSLTGDAASAYVQIRTLEKRLAIAHENVTTAEESLRLADIRFQGGTTSELDVQQAKTALYGTQATIPLLESELRQSKNALCVLLGIPPSDLEDVLSGSESIPVPPPQVIVGIPAELLRRRPDIRSAELQAMAQCAQIGFAKAELLPAFSLTGSFGFLSTDLGTFKLSDLASSKAVTYSAGPSFQWNILNYGRITNNVRLQDARFQELLLTYRNTVLQAQKEVEDALTAFLRSQENAEYLAKTAESAKRSLDIATIQYTQGTTDFLAVLTAQVALLRAQNDLATALGTIASNLVALYRALGGGWQIRLGHEILSPEVKEMMERRTNWGNLLTPAAYMPPETPPKSEIRRPDW